jgi:hypothetical protein
MAPVISLVESGASLGPGEIEAIAFGGRRDLIDKVRVALLQAQPESDLALACGFALGRLEDKSEETIPALVRQLGVPSHRHAARLALLGNGSDTAIRELVNDLRSNFDHALAVDLLRFPDVASAVEGIILEQLGLADNFDLATKLAGLLQWVENDTMLRRLLGSDRTLELLHEMAVCEEGSGWITGAKVTAIRGLALFDKEAAYQAAVNALAIAENHDREQYPYLLVEIMPQRALNSLTEQAKREPTTAVKWAISRALRILDCQEAFKTLFASEADRVRETACELCARWRPDAWVTDQLRLAMDDDSARVANAARESLELVETRIIGNELVEAIATELDVCHRWNLLEALLDTADPGDDGQPMPDWGHRIEESLPFAMWAFVAEELPKRRKKLLEQARKKDEERKRA